MTDLTLAERESLESLIQHAAEQTRTDAERAEAQARFEQQMRDLNILRACETGAARLWLDGVDLGSLVGPDDTELTLFKSLGRAARTRALRRFAALPLDTRIPVELLDPVTGECRHADP